MTARPAILDVPVDVGSGRPIVVLHGYGLEPRTYLTLATELSRRCRVVIPSLFALPGRWRCSEVLDAFTRTLDRLGLDTVTLIGHSFGGGIELGFAARHLERVETLVFADTLACSREWRLAEEALRHPLRLLWMATPTAAAAFAQAWAAHPVQLIDAAWWGFVSGRTSEVERVAAASIPAHVLWANRDSVLSRADGRKFAHDLGATFDVVRAPAGKAVDHDWMYRHPELFIQHLLELGLPALHADEALA